MAEQATGNAAAISGCHSRRRFNFADVNRKENAMSNRILVLYGSYRSDRMGIRLAQFVV